MIFSVEDCQTIMNVKSEREMKRAKGTRVIKKSGKNIKKLRNGENEGPPQEEVEQKR